MLSRSLGSKAVMDLTTTALCAGGGINRVDPAAMVDGVGFVLLGGYYHRPWGKANHDCCFHQEAYY